MENKEPLRISVADAHARSAGGDVTFLDVVDPAAYEKIDYQIEGAVRIDPREIKEAYERLPMDQEILAYCT